MMEFHNPDLPPRHLKRKEPEKGTKSVLEEKESFWPREKIERGMTLRRALALFRRQLHETQLELQEIEDYETIGGAELQDIGERYIQQGTTASARKIQLQHWLDQEVPRNEAFLFSEFIEADFEPWVDGEGIMQFREAVIDKPELLSEKELVYLFNSWRHAAQQINSSVSVFMLSIQNIEREVRKLGSLRREDEEAGIGLHRSYMELQDGTAWEALEKSKDHLTLEKERMEIELSLMKERLLSLKDQAKKFGYAARVEKGSPLPLLVKDSLSDEQFQEAA